MEETVRIETLAYGGDGVGHLADGRVVFVPRTCPGDRVLVTYEDSQERFVRAMVSEIVEAAQARTVPPCAEAQSGRCGGCPWAHISYDEQLRWKRQALVDALTRIGKLPAEQAGQLVSPCVPSKRQWHYRNKLEFDVGKDAGGRLALGMHAAAGAFSPITSCELCPKKFRKAPKALTGALRFIQGGYDLGLERVGVRFSERTGDVEIAVWTKTGQFPRAQAAKVLSDALPAKKPSIVRVLLKGEAKERKVSKVEVLAGHGNWSERIDGRRMLLSAPSFFQVNTPGAETLIELVMKGLEPDGLDSVLDLYSGAGTFTLPLSERAMSVAAVEAAGSSVRDLRRNLEKNQLFAEVIGGDTARALPELGYVDKVVVDPPRSGLGAKAIEGLLACGAKTLAYVSCNPTTLARDLAALLAGGYELRKLTPVDLFPQTYHVETVVLMSRAKD